MKENKIAVFMKNIAFNIACKANDQASLVFLKQPKVDRILREEIRRLKQIKKIDIIVNFLVEEEYNGILGDTGRKEIL